MDKQMFSRIQNGNDVRGAAFATETEKQTISPEIADLICRAFAQVLSEQLGKAKGDLRIGVGHDSRVTAEAMAAGCFKGLSDLHAFDCGLITTPAMFQSTLLPESDFDGAIMITASHLPSNRNGLKFFTKAGAMDKKTLTKILDLASDLAEQLALDDQDTLIRVKTPAGDRPAEAFDMRRVYADHMKKLICENVKAEDYEHPLKGLHIVEDAGNGAAGFFATDILAPLGADISGSVFLDPDGTFPNHVPNPENKTAMDAIQKAVLENKADLGVIFDCDGDRGAAVLGSGQEVNRNSLIALLAAIVKKTAPGSTVVTDSVTSDELAVFLTRDLGLKHLRFKRGYKNVIDEGIRLNANGERCELAIETSGHGAFKENHFSDDGAYICLKLICELALLRREGKDLDSLIENLKTPAEAEEVRFDITAEDFKAYGADVLERFKAFAENQPLFHVVSPNYEGVRVAFDDEAVKGWVLLRMSLHDPVMPMNLESSREGGLEEIKKRLKPFFDTCEALK